jgi:hypothetical protein
MKSFKDYEPSVQCDICDKHLLIGDNPNNPIFETCVDCIEINKYVSKWLTEKKNPIGIDKQQDIYDIDETILYSSPSADKIEKEIFDLFGYEIGISESGEDWEVFLIRPNDINGNTYISFLPEDL